MIRLSKVAVAIALTLPIFAAATTTSIAAAPDHMDHFTFGWNAAISETISHVTFGEELGFFKKEHIKLEIIQLQGSSNVLQQILAGNLDTGYVGLEAGSITKNRLGKSPLKFIYNYARQTIWEIVVPKNSPIKTIRDLKGKKVSTGSLASGNVPVTYAILNQLGMSKNDITFIATGQGAPAFRALQTGEVAAQNLYDTQNATLNAEVMPIRALPFPPPFDSIPSHGFPVTNKELATRKDLLERFGRAWSESIVACKAALHKCIRSYWRAYPSRAPKPGDEAKAMKLQSAIMEARLAKLTYFKKGLPRLYGSFPDGVFGIIAKYLKASGQIKDSTGPFSDLYTNELVPAYNYFDVKKVQELARGFNG